MLSVPAGDLLSLFSSIFAGGLDEGGTAPGLDEGGMSLSGWLVTKAFDAYEAVSHSKFVHGEKRKAPASCPETSLRFCAVLYTEANGPSKKVRQTRKLTP